MKSHVERGNWWKVEEIGADDLVLMISQTSGFNKGQDPAKDLFSLDLWWGDEREEGWKLNSLDIVFVIKKEEILVLGLFEVFMI